MQVENAKQQMYRFIQSAIMFFLLDLANSVVLLKTQNDGDKEQKALDNKLALTGTF